MTATLSTPFTSSAQLCHDLTLTYNSNGTPTLTPATHHRSRYLPGQPYVSLDAAETVPYLERELMTPQLNRMAPHLWLVATPRSSHVSALHEQLVRGRAIVITENPELHLVWIDGRVFVKPLPAYLLSCPFWECFLSGKDSDEHRQALARAAVGFVRTFYWLIQHESDFELAKEKRLIPAKVRWPQFVNFIKPFGEVEDALVSGRYHFGELRLSRLNFWAKFILRKGQFYKVAWQYADYFARLYAPILFVFAVASVVLGAMQVGVATRPTWDVFSSVSAWFSVVTLVLVATVLVWFLMILFVMSGRELVYALRHQIRRARRKQKAQLANGQAKFVLAESKA